MLLLLVLWLDVGLLLDDEFCWLGIPATLRGLSLCRADALMFDSSAGLQQAEQIGRSINAFLDFADFGGNGD